MPLRLLALILLLSGSSAFAENRFGLGSAQPENDFLPVEQAFIPSAEMKPGGVIHAHWDIADGYYLYRHALQFTLADGNGATLGTAQIPAGVQKEDEYFGTVETYHRTLDVMIPVKGSFTPGAVPMVQLRYQGCAERGLCYPPQTAKLPLTLPASGGAVSSAQSPASPVAIGEQERVAKLIASHSLFWVVLSFFGFGILLAFTPCILPMLPILSSIIAGADEDGMRGGFQLSLAYVLAMALAYTFFGVIAGLTGANLQAFLQAPVVIYAFSGVFVVLALSMFGLFHLQLPAALQTRLTAISDRHRRGGLLGAGVMGFLSALIVGPCLAPPLAGALLYIGKTGSPYIGGLALFSLGLGMGLPLLAIGIAEGSLLPKTGLWMEKVKHFFGFVLLGVAIWMLDRLLSPRVMLGLWAGFSAGTAIYLLKRNPRQIATLAVVRLSSGVLASVYAMALIVGVATNASSPLYPLAPLFNNVAENAEAGPEFQKIKTIAELNLALNEARERRQPVLLDFYADWCVSCVQMEREVFANPKLRGSLARVRLLRADVTANDDDDRALLKHLKVYGPPTVLFFSANGMERSAYRLVGETGADQFAALMGTALSGDACGAYC